MLRPPVLRTRRYQDKSTQSTSDNTSGGKGCDVCEHEVVRHIYLHIVSTEVRVLPVSSSTGVVVGLPSSLMNIKGSPLSGGYLGCLVAYVGGTQEDMLRTRPTMPLSLPHIALDEPNVDPLWTRQVYRFLLHQPPTPALTSTPSLVQDFYLLCVIRRYFIVLVGAFCGY